jgi:hypothetical protein
MMTHFVGLDVSQKMTAICVVDNSGHSLWRVPSRRVLKFCGASPICMMLSDQAARSMI